MTDQELMAALRVKVANSPHVIYQNASQKSDLLNGGITQGCLINLLADLIAKSYYIEITACDSDHHDDSDLGLHCHHNGYCIDCWPLNSSKPGDYMDENSHGFRQFLHDVSTLKELYQIGLGGSADIPADKEAAGPTVFDDNGADHVHIGAKYA